MTRQSMPRQRPTTVLRDSPLRTPEHTVDDRLRYIRDVMARSGAFTAVPGFGMVVIGIMALVGAGIGEMQSSEIGWVTVWMVTATVAIAFGTSVMIRKARRHGVPLGSGAGRRFVLSLLPPFVAAAIVTAALLGAELFRYLPGLWLLLYGAGTVTGGAFSVRSVQTMGLAFMLIGSVALFLPFSWASISMAVGFGGLHIFFGTWIARDYGG